MTKRRVVITGMGAVTPIGTGVDDFWEASLRGTSGVNKVTLFNAENFEICIAAEVKNFNPSHYILPEIYRKTDRFAQMGVAAAKMAIDDAGIETKINPKSNNIPVIIGSGLGGSLFHEEQMLRYLEGNDPRKVYSSTVARVAPNAVSAYIAIQFKFRGPNATISTACSSGGNAIAMACGLIHCGFSDIAVTGGAECPITPVTFAGYQSLRVLSKGGANGFNTPRPFDKRRDGFVLGEGAGVLILEEFQHAKARGAKIYAELLGYSSNCGAYHMAAPDPSAEDAVDAIEQALKMARITPKDVNYINAHGTATQLNDVCEAKAIGSVFGFGPKGPYVSSTKSQTGHTIGAAGAIEAILTALAVKNNTMPPTINCDELDENCNINVIRKDAVKKEVKYAVSNSFGFGSNNSVLVFGKINNETGG